MKIGSKTTNPGELRTTITLDKPTAALGTGGFTTRSFTSQATVKSRWKNLYGSELIAADVEANRVPARVLIRYHAEINESWTITKDGQRFEIKGLDNIDARGEYIELTVQRMVGG